MNVITLKKLVKEYCDGFPDIKPLGVMLDKESENSLLNYSFPQFSNLPKKVARELVETHFKKAKPCGLEFVIWNSEETGVFFPVRKTQEAN